MDRLVRRLERLQAELCELVAMVKGLGENNDPDRDLIYILEHYGVGRDAILKAADRGELRIRRGVKDKILVRQSELDRWRDSWPSNPRIKRAKPLPQVDPEAVKDAEAMAWLRGLPGGAR